jgi:peptide-methionine (S)-S-oxide reductase
MKEHELEKATFAAGCFWGVEAAFRQIPGVVATRVGYTGGHTDDPTYERVCSHTTGHAEAVEVTFDPERVSYEQLLDVFWTNHNPTTKNRQGFDIGDQYRSAVFFHSREQQEAAERTKEAVEAKLHWPKKVVTEIVPAPEFYEAEDYHQRYLEKRGSSSCTVELAEAQTAS